jgi:hypothetical protein
MLWGYTRGISKGRHEEPKMIATTASQVAPSEYSIDARRPEVGMVFEDVARIGTERFEVVGEPFYLSYNLFTARVREVGGRHDGNEFTAYLRTR